MEAAAEMIVKTVASAMKRKYGLQDAPARTPHEVGEGSFMLVTERGPLAWKDEFQEDEGPPKKKSRTCIDKEIELTERIREDVTKFEDKFNALNDKLERVSALIQMKGIDSFDDILSQSVRRSSCTSQVDLDSLDLLQITKDYIFFPLPVPTDKIGLLHQAWTSYIQWPKKGSILDEWLQDPIVLGWVPSDTTNSTPRASTPAPTANPSQASIAIPSQPSTETIAKPKASTKPKGKNVKSKPMVGAKKKKKEYEPPKFKHGHPLLPEKQLLKIDHECQTLHKFYLSRFQHQTSIMVPFETAHFHYENKEISLAFQDLWDLYNWKELDISILRTSTLCMLKLASTLPDVSVGFLDPEKICDHFLKDGYQQSMAYMTKALLAQQDKEYIFAPYLQNAHWMLLVICPRRNEVYYLDSVEHRREKEKITVTLLISRYFNEAFRDYKKEGGRHMESLSNIVQWKSFKCHQQPSSWECGFYVMRHMYELITTYLAEFPENAMSASPYKLSNLEEIRRFFVQFLLDEVVSKIQNIN